MFVLCHTCLNKQTKTKNTNCPKTNNLFDRFGFQYKPQNQHRVDLSQGGGKADKIWVAG